MLMASKLSVYLVYLCSSCLNVASLEKLYFENCYYERALF